MLCVVLSAISLTQPQSAWRTVWVWNANCEIMLCENLVGRWLCWRQRCTQESVKNYGNFRIKTFFLGCDSAWSWLFKFYAIGWHLIAPKLYSDCFINKTHDISSMQVQQTNGLLKISISGTLQSLKLQVMRVFMSARELLIKTRSFPIISSADHVLSKRWFPILLILFATNQIPSPKNSIN